MEYINIKNTELLASRICFGGCPLGGYGWGVVDDEELIKTIRIAIQNGVNFFDTADIYGLGRSEEILGEALKENRKNVIIATKFGVRIIEGKTIYDNSPRWIEESIENSLKRLNTDYIDIYQIHYRDKITPIKDIVDTLRKLKKEGKIRYFGLSNILDEDIIEIEPYKEEFVSFQEEFSLANRNNEKKINAIKKALNISLFTWGSLGQGILTGKYDEKSTFSEDDRRSRKTYSNFHGEKLKNNMEIVSVLRKISNEINKPISAIAIRFILDCFEDSIVLAGIKNEKQLYMNCEAFGWKLSNKHYSMLEEISKKYGG